MPALTPDPPTGGSFSSPEFRRARRILRWVALAVLVVGLILGAVGLLALSVSGLELPLTEVELMTGVYQPPDAGGVPLSLDVARVVVPLATTALVFLIATDLLTLVRSRKRDHTIVVGSGAAATAIAAELHGSGPILTTPAGDEDSLHDSGVRQARSIVIVGDDDNGTATNVATARAAMGRSTRPDFTAHLLVGDPGLALALRARRLAQPDQRRLLVFTLDELAVRAHVRAVPLDSSTRPHILVVGSGPFGRAVIVEYARRWSASGAHEPLPVTLVADDAARARDEIVDRWPFVAQWCALRVVEEPVETAMLLIAQRPYRSYFGDPDEQRALRTALTAATRWRPDPGSIVVRLTRLTTSSLFDDFGGALEAVSVYAAAASEMLTAEEPLLAFARAIHDSYLDDALRRGEILRSRPNLVPWPELAPEVQQANLVQALAFPRTLAAIRCTVAPRTRLANPFYYLPGDVEDLARGEHEHWVAEQTALGWRPGPTRDDRRRVDPLLVPWATLSPTVRSRNRAIVRSRPLIFDRVLEREGLQIVRLAVTPTEATPAPAPPWLFPEAVEHLAQIIHENYLATRQAQGVAMLSTPAMRPWASLDEDRRRANRAQALDLGNKIDLLEAEVTPDPPTVPFQFTDEEVEALARYEHDRWVAERIAEGWTYGTVRDEANKIHDRLLPWLYLPADQQRLVRETILAIPTLIQSAAGHIRRR